MKAAPDMKNWRSAAFSSAARPWVPPVAGVYAILRVSRLFGLPHDVEVLYIGRSENLKLRLSQHLNRDTAHNSVSFVPDRSVLEFWFHVMPSDMVAAAEKALIRTVNPKTNLIRYRADL